MKVSGTPFGTSWFVPENLAECVDLMVINAKGGKYTPAMTALWEEWRSQFTDDQWKETDADLYPLPIEDVRSLATAYGLREFAETLRSIHAAVTA